MKAAVSIAILVILLGAPLSCLLLACQAPNPAHDCCPRNKTAFKCPYDVLDTAKTPIPHVAALPVVFTSLIAPPVLSPIIKIDVEHEFDGNAIHIKNRVLRI